MFLNYDNLLKHFDCIVSPFTPLKYTADAESILVVNENMTFLRSLPLLMIHPRKYNLIIIGDTDFTFHNLHSIKPFVKHIYIHNGRINDNIITKLPCGFKQEFNPPKEIRETNKDILCYLPPLNFYDSNNLHHLPGRIFRLQCKEYFKNISFVTVEDQTQLSQDEYCKQISRSKFVICPMGVGIDTFRVYETAYIGSTPIVVKNGMEDLYKKFGVLVVDRWEDITEELLQNHKHYQPPDELFELEYWLPKK